MPILLLEGATFTRRDNCIKHMKACCPHVRVHCKASIGEQHLKLKKEHQSLTGEGDYPCETYNQGFCQPAADKHALKPPLRSSERSGSSHRYVLNLILTIAIPLT